MSNVIEVRQLRKSFGSTNALQGIDLDMGPGEVHGFLGPNGAGKSTTIRVLLGLLRADSGETRVLGGHPWHDAVTLHRRLAYVPGDVELWPQLTGGEVIDIFARLRGKEDRARRDQLCERFDLDPAKKCRTYSKGNRQKVALISALVSDVELLLLDEPTAGLDPLMEVVFQDCIKEAKSAGRSVLLSSHILSQVEVLADRISIIRKGEIVESGSLQELRHFSRTTVSVETAMPPERLGELSGVHNLEITDSAAQFEIDGEHVATTLEYLARLGVRSIVAQPPTLDALLLRHYDVGSDSDSAGRVS